MLVFLPCYIFLKLNPLLIVVLLKLIIMLLLRDIDFWLQKNNITAKNTFIYLERHLLANIKTMIILKIALLCFSK